MSLMTHARNRTSDLISRAAPPQSEETLAAAAAAHWNDAGAPRWKLESHWRSGLGEERWSRVGPRQLDLTRTLLSSLGRDVPRGRILEWGCGGGANAVTFAALCDEFVGLDIAGPSLDECHHQVMAGTGRDIATVLVDPTTPETAVPSVGAGTVDLVICFYVFELLASRRSAEQVLAVIRELLADDGAAVVQIKYDDGSRSGGARTRDYRRHVAHMTTFKVHEFWSLCQGLGLQPRVMTLVPEDELDSRYAYYLLTRS